MNKWVSRTGWFATGAVALIVIVFAILTAAPSLLAQQPGPGKGPWLGHQFGGRGFSGGPFGELGMAMRELNLTDAQRTQVRSIMQAHRTEMESLAQRMRNAHLALQTAAESGGDVQAASSDLASVLADGATFRAGVQKEIWAILTPEQQEKAKALKAEHEQRMQQRMQRMKDFKPRGGAQGQ